MRFRYFLLFLNLSVFSLTTIFLSFLLFSIFLSLSSCCLYRGYSSLNLVHILPGAHISLRGPCVLWSIYHSVVHVSVCGTYYINHSLVHILLRGTYITLWSICRSVVHSSSSSTTQTRPQPSWTRGCPWRMCPTWVPGPNFCSALGWRSAGAVGV